MTAFTLKMSSAKSPAVPSPQIPICVICASAVLDGHVLGVAVGSQHLAPWSVHPPVKSDHSYV